MSQAEVDTIKQIFAQHNLHPTYLEHEAVITSEEAAATRNFPLKSGIKALLFTNGVDFVICNVPADQKVDTKKLCSQLNWSRNKTRMATSEEVEERTGCLIGSVPPFGHKTSIPILVDKAVFDNETSAFNIGLRTHSVTIPTGDMKKVFASINAKIGDFIKSRNQ